MSDNVTKIVPKTNDGEPISLLIDEFTTAIVEISETSPYREALAAAKNVEHLGFAMSNTHKMNKSKFDRMLKDLLTSPKEQSYLKHLELLLGNNYSGYKDENDRHNYRQFLDIYRALVDYQVIPMPGTQELDNQESFKESVFREVVWYLRNIPEDAPIKRLLFCYVAATCQYNWKKHNTIQCYADRIRADLAKEHSDFLSSDDVKRLEEKHATASEESQKQAS
jgi:hypothetical protein